MTPLKTLAVVAALGLTTAACQTDEMAYTGLGTNAASTETLGSDVPGYKPVDQIPGNAAHPNPPGIPGESTAHTRSPGARANNPVP